MLRGKIGAGNTKTLPQLAKFMRNVCIELTKKANLSDEKGELMLNL